MPERFKSLWRDTNVRVIMVQTIDTYGSTEMVAHWIDRLGPCKSRIHDVSQAQSSLVILLTGVWSSTDVSTGKSLVPVLESVTPHLMAELKRILSTAKPHHRVVIVSNDVYSDNPMIREMRQAAYTRVCKSYGLGPASIKKCLGLIVHHCKAMLTPPEHTVLLRECTDPRAVFEALRWRARINNKGALMLPDRAPQLADSAALLLDMSDNSTSRISTRVQDWADVRSRLLLTGARLHHQQRLDVVNVDQRIKQIRAVFYLENETIRARFKTVLQDDPRIDVPLGETSLVRSLNPSTETFIHVGYPTAVRTITGTDSLDTLASIANDLSLADVLSTPYASKDALVLYANDIMASTTRIQIRRRYPHAKTPSGWDTANALSREFYTHTDHVKEHSHRRRDTLRLTTSWNAIVPKAPASGRLCSEWDVEPETRALTIPSRPLSTELFFHRHITWLWDVWIHVDARGSDPIRDAIRYAAVALMERPPRVGQLSKRPGWVLCMPPAISARALAVWFADRCTYPWFETGEAWAMAWSALASEPSLFETISAQQIQALVGNMLSKALECNTVPIPLVHAPKDWCGFKGLDLSRPPHADKAYAIQQAAQKVTFGI